MELKVVPKVKALQADIVGKYFTKSAAQTIYIGAELDDNLIDVLQEDLQSTCPYTMKSGEDESTSALYSASIGEVSLDDDWVKSLPVDDESYGINIQTNGLRLVAHSAAGFFYGWQTLCQLLRQTEIPCGMVIDQPQVKVRCLHIDLKGQCPKFDYLLELVKKLSRLKINTILLEYEDKLHYDSQPLVADPDQAYSKQQISQLIELCRLRFIKIIPKIQCYGHWDYILKHPEYRDLRGGDGVSSYQICPSVERAFDVWQAMTDELLKLHRDAEYFHIGADEVKLKLACSKCHEQDRFKLYINHVERAADYLRAHHKKVLIWDDVFRNHDIIECNDLLNKTELCVWQYRAVNEQFTTRALEIGATVWAASAIQIGDATHPDLTPTKKRFENLDDWSRVIEKHQLQAHISTAWTRTQSQTPAECFLPGSFYLIAAFAESSWGGKPLNQADFDQRFPLAGFGIDHPALAEVAHDFTLYPDDVVEKLKPLLGKVKLNSDIFEIWLILNELESLKTYINLCFTANQSLYPAYQNGTATIEIKHNFLDGVKIIRERIAEIAEKLTTRFPPYMASATIQEMIHSRFDAIQMLNDQWEQIIKASKTI